MGEPCEFDGKRGRLSHGGAKFVSFRKDLVRTVNIWQAAMPLRYNDCNVFHTLNLGDLPVAINPRECRICTRFDLTDGFTFAVMVKQTKYEVAAIKKDLGEVFAKAVAAITRFPGDKVNIVPAPGAWSAANVADHLTKSNVSIAKALLLRGEVTNRNAGERIPELESVFLDYTKKFEAPAFILPGKIELAKEEVITAYQDSCNELLALCEEVDFSEMINHRAFGDITKYEILHFVKFHTIRHIAQMEKIYSALEK